nr:MAG TPA: hypothetical protein [Caudoviricetes sp.]
MLFKRRHEMKPDAYAPGFFLRFFHRLPIRYDNQKAISRHVTRYYKRISFKKDSKGRIEPLPP